MHQRALELINKLQLTKHPEGGYYKEVFRSDVRVYSEKIKAHRQAMTDIYFLLPKGEVSKFHNVIHDEIWHFYEGDPIKLHITDEKGHNYESSILGKKNASVINYKFTVKGEYWQAAETMGDYSLVGCTVGAGFDFEDFKLLDRESEMSSTICQNNPELGKFIG